MIETRTIMQAAPESTAAETSGRAGPSHAPDGPERTPAASRQPALVRQPSPGRPMTLARVTAARARPILTVAAVVERDGRYLFVEEQTRTGLRLNQPAGHVEAGESIAAAAVRETLEESAWYVEPVALVGVYHWEASDRGATFVRFTFAATAHRHDPMRALDTGIVRALWLTYEESVGRAAQHRSPLVLRALDDYRSGVRWPLGVIARL